jgi:diguanylate cyclase (GGDEF)-like protein
MVEKESGPGPTNPPPSEVADKTSKERDRTSAHRDRTSESRDRTAAGRDRTSEDRDRDAEVRDRAAESRDRLSDALEADSSTVPLGTDERRQSRAGRRRTDVSARSDRVSAASDRADAASDRESAGAGRKRGALDRTQASGDRDAASVDREVSARDREVSSIDELTGAYRRGSGLVELEREMLRATRTRQSFVVAFVDVDGLKSINDSLGHDAGDRLLRRAVDAIRSHLRSYDLVIRFGGDEFVCGLSNLGLGEATERFKRVNAELASDRSSLTVGLAELKGGNSLVELIAEADEALYRKREPGRSRE